MQFFVESLTAGDNSVLPEILFAIGEHPFNSSTPSMSWEKLLYQHLVRLLLMKGRQVKISPTLLSQASEAEDYVLAQRILFAAFSLGAERCSKIRSALLEVGINGCREMCLDRYLEVLPRSRAVYIKQFVSMLVNIFRADVSDFLIKQENIQMIEGTYQQAHAGGIRRGSGGGSSNSSSRRGSMQSRTHSRTWKDLPAKPSYIPFSQNPLFHPHPQEGENREDEESSWIAPHFPSPVLSFAVMFGINCEIRLPDLHAHSSPAVSPPGMSPGSRRSSSDASTPSRVILRRFKEAQNYEEEWSSLFSHYLRNGLLLLWGTSIDGVGEEDPCRGREGESPSPSASPLSSPSLSFAEGVESRSSQLFVSSPITLTPRVPLVSVSCGNDSCYVVSLDHNVYSCGSNKRGQLGCGKSKDITFYLDQFPHETYKRFHFVPICQEDKIVKMEAGAEFTVALSFEHNRMYVWGENMYGQCLMPDPSVIPTPVIIDVPESCGQIKHIACGSNFGAVYFSTGTIGTWGVDSMLGVNISSEYLRDTGTNTGTTWTKCAKSVILFRPIQEEIVALRAGPYHCLAITSAGHVYSWGINRSGCLGHSVASPSYAANISRIDALSNYFIIDASCGSFHSAVLTREGLVLVFGENTCGQLGLYNERCRTVPELLPLPKCAIAISCGREHTCILLEDGDVMSCGTLRSCGMSVGSGARFNIPQRIFHNYLIFSLASKSTHGMALGLLRTFTMQIMRANREEELEEEEEDIRRINQIISHQGVRTVCSGNGFMIMVTECNEMWSFGKSQKRQLNTRGDDDEEERNKNNLCSTSTLRNITLPDNIRMTALYCGADYTVGITNHCHVYSWGYNSHGQLGHGDVVPLHSSLFYPKEISSLHRLGVIQIACGGTFVLALSQDGEVYTWGESLYCGHEKGIIETTCLKTPMLLERVRDVISIAAGVSHAVALTYNNKIYIWGKGILGNGGKTSYTTIQYTPMLFNFPQSIRKIGCGPFNTFIITDLGELYVWDMNEKGVCGVQVQQQRQQHTLSSSLTSLNKNINAHNVDKNRGCADSCMLRKQSGRAGIQQSLLSSSFSSEVLFPTCVASHVRDAAFSVSTGLLIKEDGSSWVAGQLYKNGKRNIFPEFTPQQFSIQTPKKGSGAASPVESGEPSSSRVFLSRCFSGFDTLIALLELNRPSPAEVAGVISNMNRCFNASDRRKV